MSVDRTGDLETLNAFVDGELSADERARIAARIAAEPDLARAHATLARLRAGLSDYAETTQPPQISFAKRHVRNLWGSAAAAVAVVTIMIALGLHFLPQETQVAALDEAGVQPVALGNKPMIPDLSAAGLTLVRVDGRMDRPLDRLMAVYSGPRGCKLELYVRLLESADIVVPAATHRKSWSDGALVYQLFAFGMPQQRFATIAEAAERQTRALTPSGQDRLREARRNAPPCVG